MVVFVCDTPYQFLLTMDLAFTEFKNQPKTLVLYNKFARAQIAHDVIAQYPIFDDIVFIDEQWNQSYQKYKWIRRFHSFRNEEFERICKKCSIEKLIIFPIDPPRVSLMIKLALKYHPNCECFVAEDGMGTYVTWFNMFPVLQKGMSPGWKGRLLFSFLGRKKYYEKLKGVYCCSPELLEDAIPMHQRYRIPKIPINNPVFRELFFSIFGERDIKYQDIILLHQPYGLSNYHRLENNQNNIFRDISLKFSYASTGVKLHPRDRGGEMWKGIDVISGDIAFELLIANGINTSVIVSVTSTAAYTPFLLWGYTVPLIFLHKLFMKDIIDYELGYDSINSFVERFRGVYKQHGGRIYVPETIEELYTNIEAILNSKYSNHESSK